MNCIVVDDEPLAREGLELYIDRLDGLNHLKSFENAILASAFLKQEKVDLIFLDIQMPGITGIEFLRMMSIDPLVILTTAYSDYALEAYELDVVDYLLKPIKEERFQKAVLKASDIFEAKQHLGQNNIERIESDYFYVRANRKHIKLFYKDILFVKGMKDYVLIRTEGEKFMTAMNIKTINEKLPQNMFCRVSKSYIVHTAKVKSLKSDTLFLADYEIPLGKAYKVDYFKRFIPPKTMGR